MGSQSEYWTEVYAKTHEERLAQSMQFAREELAAKYGAAETRAKYMGDLVTMYDKALTDAQKALVDYETARGRKARDPKAEADAAVAYLKIMTDAGSTIATEFGKAKERELEAEGVVEGRYRLSGGQSSAIGSAGDKIAATVDSTFRTSADIDRAVGASLGGIPDGTFAPGTDAAKTAAAELFTRLDAELKRTSPTVYGNDSSAGQRLKDAIAAKTGVPSTFTERAEVEDDKLIAIGKAKKTVGKTGAGLSSEAGQLAKDRLAQLGVPISDKGAEALGKIDWGGKYFDLIAGGATIAEAKAAIKGGMTDGKKTAFEDQFTEIRTALSASRDSDQAKLFDPTYVDVYARSIKSGKSLTAAQEKFGLSVDALSDVPTEEAARRRGADIYEPISPGVRRRTSEGVTRLEERAQDARIAGVPMSDDDLMSSRLLQAAPQISDSRRIMTGASAAAVRELNAGWTPDKFKAGRGADFGGTMSPEEFEAIGAGPSVGLGYRLYSNVKDRQLRDTSPDAILKYAADLAGGDVGLRDSVLQEYYKHSVYEMRGTKAMKAKADVQKVEAPKPVIPEVDVKSEELGF